MRTIALAQRRTLVARRHHLLGDATTTEQVARAVLALHATDPASVFLAVLARSATTTIVDALDAMYAERTLVRWMAMRRTLFVFPRDRVPVFQAAVSRPLAATLRRRLTSTIARNGTVPAIDGDPGAWIESVEAGVERAIRTLGTASGAQLSAAEPRLRTAITPRAPSDLPMNVTSPLLVVMSTEGRLVRGGAVGTWTTRAHRWEPVDAWWPDGLPSLDTAGAQVEVARAWLTAFGPAPVADLEWWTGWTKTAVRAALGALPVLEVDLAGTAGVMLDEPVLHEELDRAATPDDPVATLLPCLDPTPMGWKDRGWLFGTDPDALHDRNGNLGATVWWDGEVVGGWGTAASGEVRTRVVVDRGRAAADAVERAAATLQQRIDGAVVTPAFRTPLERALTA
ncbi:winged helix DNA-binding domain-containing protein [Curtobacterium sp. RRHDQ10]|uniref:winged helix DNA-binding domain-containing protein n=1 Tax=Curtobacterium phyllosphaerae TaxID=3413379 RepID=UPI003BF0B343